MRRRTLIRRLSHGLMLLGGAFWTALAAMALQSAAGGREQTVLLISGGMLVAAGFALWIVANIREGRND